MKPVPVKSSPRDVFLYMLTVITLYMSVWRFIDLWFQYIHRFFHDSLKGWEASGDIRFSIAALIVVFPVYIGLTWFLRKDTIAHPEKRKMWVRKWLLNFTLFLTALTIIIDLITLINNFLNGEFTMRFFLKVLVVLIVAGAVFGYYFWDLRRETLPGSRPSRLLVVVAALVVVGSIIGGFFIIGSPMTQRNLRLDGERVNHLQTLQNEIINYWRQEHKLPDSLDNLKDRISGFVLYHDPVSAKPYEYRVTDKLSFELCAVFSGVTHQGQAYSYPPPSPYMPQISNWEHGAGRTCFASNIDQDLYKLKTGFVPRPIRFAD